MHYLALAAALVVSTGCATTAPPEFGEGGQWLLGRNGLPMLCSPERKTCITAPNAVVPLVRQRLCPATPGRRAGAPWTV